MTTPRTIRTFQLCLRLDQAALLLRKELERFGFVVAEEAEVGGTLPRLVERRHDRVRRLYLHDTKSQLRGDSVSAQLRQIVLSQVYGGFTLATVVDRADDKYNPDDIAQRAQDVRLVKAVLATGMSAFSHREMTVQLGVTR